MIPPVRTTLLLLPLLTHAATLDEAIRTLAAKTTPHLSPTESARVTVRNLSPLPATDAQKAQAALDQALRKRVRNMSIVDVSLTLSQNVKGYLLIAEIHSSEPPAVEMVPFQPDEPHEAPLLPLTKRLLWEQDDPILDLAITGDRMLILTPDRILRRDKERIEATPIPAPPVRDPRGRMEASAETVNIFVPGVTCRGTQQPFKIVCEPLSAEFMLDGAAVRFTPGRNTLEGARGETVAVCAGKQLTSPADDTVVLYDGPTAISEAVELPGPITALWPSTGGALAVIRNPSTKRYAAYALAVDCGR